MGLSKNSVGRGSIDSELKIDKKEGERIIALAGNPNVGKSTVFNALTGMNQHTGNWPGKTVATAQGRTSFHQHDYILVDIPGTYSLMAHSQEEEVARDFICFDAPDAVAVVCDATCLERNLNLVLQTMEITDHVILCLNLIDEAKKKHIKIDIKQLSDTLGIPVVAVCGRNGRGLNDFMQEIEQLTWHGLRSCPLVTTYPAAIEEAAQDLMSLLPPAAFSPLNRRWCALQLLDCDSILKEHIFKTLALSDSLQDTLEKRLQSLHNTLRQSGYEKDSIKDALTARLVITAEGIAADCVTFEEEKAMERDRKIDRILTGKMTGIPIMLALLAVVFYITIVGANYPSALLSKGLFWLQDFLYHLSFWNYMPGFIREALIMGVYRVLAWVVSVMLPPMAIFFPLFTLLEDVGYLPRVAFNLDHVFKKCSSCGKQALTTCMGFGCNAAGVVGCRIIDSPRERLIAIITNNFVPCNGRFPTLISLITMFFVAGVLAPFQTLSATLVLTAVILLGIFVTFGCSKLLSKTVLKGEPSSFTLELPPFRRPQIWKTIVRSVFDRTLFVLGRAVVVAAPAGLIIWLMANVSVDGQTLLTLCSHFLNPFAKWFGLDGVILLAFILGFPANEIVLPIIIMAYMATGSILELDNLAQLKTLLVSNGWTYLTALNTMLFSLMHWPCSTSCITIYKETKSIKWTALSMALPTVIGLAFCFITTLVSHMIGFF